MMAPSIVRSRQDVRLAGNTAPLAAAEGPVLPVFVLDDAAVGDLGYSSEARGAGGEAALPLLREIPWREFSHHLLWHRPELTRSALRERFAAFPFVPDQELLVAWHRGGTGYPVADARMRQLWRNGWMHNRVRMIASSLLVKRLPQPWRDGFAWFMDADPLNNGASWQWVAGSGTDSSPYFHVFDPVAQGEKFDPEGTYVRRWLPELARMPSRFIYRPREAPEAVRRATGPEESAYPYPVVELAAGSARSLAALRATSRGVLYEEEAG
ncbi:deoxyribodipyrimidine photo-lyase/cryptochrome family protein [Roseomonas sp. KE2513]|uniref:FAD-binding domain-containing protein n=1 Tax=Roseomonas sp. KE2513 TaxID=2479202 RepID=UPI0018DF1366|nr:FAD-binding domain-containing protein [Roseomonas sp. KE2513]MBI0538562.1 deoxyribodipyrimidine photo-lyase/cryptochrome family protein [Roseomonas sp. KE2513]